MLGHLASIRHEAQRLRDDAAVQARTKFMILTGPVMVLAVLAAVWLAMRFWRRRSA